MFCRCMQGDHSRACRLSFLSGIAFRSDKTDMKAFADCSKPELIAIVARVQAIAQPGLRLEIETRARSP
jgi:hypothetical protein